MKNLCIITLSFSILFSLSCKKNTSPEPQSNEYIYNIPEQTADGWETDALENVGMIRDSLVSLMNGLNNLNGDGMHSILISRNGKLVFEEYFRGYSYYHDRNVAFDQNTIHHMQSATKSVTSILTGIAIDNGFISGVGEKIYHHFPEYEDKFDAQKRKITIEHMLTMTAGFQWDENSYAFEDLRNDLGEMSRRSDYIGYLFNKPVNIEPGSEFLYNSGLPITLGVLLKKVTDLYADEFAEQYLFSKLDITEKYWVLWENRHPHTGGGLYLRPRDMLKIGELILTNGKWRGEQVLSQEWVEISTSSKIQRTYSAYGYLWTIIPYEYNSDTIPVIFATGSGGQIIAVIRELNMVVVFTGGNYESMPVYFPFDIIKYSILKSVL